MPVASVYENGGIIGQTLDFRSTEYYQLITGTQNDSFTIQATATARDILGASGGVTLPSGIQDGDLIVVACGQIDNIITEANMASGWTVLANSTDNRVGTPGVQSVILYKIATSSDSSTTFILEPGGFNRVDYKAFVLRPDDAAIVSGTTLTTGENSYATFNNPPAITVNPSGSSGPVFAVAAYAVNTGSQPSASPTPTGSQAVDSSDFYVSHWVFSRADTKPTSISWDAGDGGRNAVSLAYIEIPDSQTVTNLNRKNSGIWNLNAVYAAQNVVPINAIFDEFTTGTTVSLSGLTFSSGDNLFVFAYDESGGGGVSFDSTGWTQLDYTFLSGDGTGFVYHKIADGTETSVSITSSAGNIAIGVTVCAVPSNYTYQSITASMVSGDTGGSPDPSSLDGFRSSDISLIYGAYGDDIVTVDPPSGYTKLIGGTSGATDGGMSSALAWRNDVSGTVDPAAFSGGDDENYAVHIKLTALPVFDISYVTSATDGTDGTSFTFASQSLGGTDANDVIVVIAGGEEVAVDSGLTQISSITVDGTSATSQVQAINDDSGVRHICGVYAVTGVSSSTGNVVVTFDGAMKRCIISVYRITGTSGTLPSVSTDSASGQAATVSAALSTTGGGGAVSVAAMYVDAGSSSITATGGSFTEDVENTGVEGTNGSFASYSESSGSSTVSTTITGSVTPDEFAAVLCTFIP